MGNLSRFDFAESKYDNQIALSAIIFEWERERTLKQKTTIVASAGRSRQ
jgi:hypothetical protein